MTDPNFSFNFENTLAENDESTSRNRLTDEEADAFIKGQRNVRTVKKTASYIKKFLKFIQEPPFSENRDLKEIPPLELDNYLLHFILEVRKPDGEEYEPDSLTSFRNSIERFLREEQYPFSLIESREFAKHREALKAKRKELKGESKRP